MSFHFYFKVGAAPVSASVKIMEFLRTTTQFAIRLNTSSNIEILDSAGSVAATATGPYLANTWYRVEVLAIAKGASKSTVYLKVYENGDEVGATFATATTASTLTIHADHYSTVTSASVVRFGALIAGTQTIYMDDLIWSPDGWIELYSKGEWIGDLLEETAYPRITAINFKSEDTERDWRLTSSYDAYNSAAEHFALTTPVGANVADRPQEIPSSYTGINTSGQLEYMRFEEEGYLPLYISPTLGGILLQDYDLGAAIAKVVQDDIQGDGTEDYTEFGGAKSISLTIACQTNAFADAAYYVDLLSGWARAGRRPTLVYKMRNQLERTIALRPGELGKPIPMANNRGSFTIVNAQWIGIDGKDYSTVTKTSTIEVDDSVDVVTYGSALSEPIIRLYGPCSDPFIYNDSVEDRSQLPNARLGFTMDLDDGEFVELNMKNRTAQMYGQPEPAFSVIKQLTTSQWFFIIPYHNIIRYEDTNSTGYAVLSFKEAFQ